MIPNTQKILFLSMIERSFSHDENVPDPRHQHVHDILMGMSDDMLPSDKAKSILVDSSDRLSDLLFTQTHDYTGPLVDGFQINDITAIIQIIGNWVCESYVTILHSKDVSVEDVYNTRSIINFSVDLLLALHEKKIIQVEIVHRYMLKTMITLFYPAMEDMLGKIEKHMYSSCSCLVLQKRREKNLNKMIESESKRLCKKKL